MKTPKFTQDSSIKTDPRLKSHFQLAFKELQLVERAQFGDRPPEMQSVTAALWLWFVRLGKEERADWLAAEFPAVIAYLRGDGADEGAPAADPQPGRKKTRKA